MPSSVAPTGAREVFEPRQGYGASIRPGIASTDADIVYVVEPDGMFEAARCVQAARVRRSISTSRAAALRPSGGGRASTKSVISGAVAI
jgi:hypothetical protein